MDSDPTMNGGPAMPEAKPRRKARRRKAVAAVAVKKAANGRKKATNGRKKGARKAARKVRKTTRKVARKVRKVVRKAGRKAKKAVRKGARKARKAVRKGARKARKTTRRKTGVAKAGVRKAGRRTSNQVGRFAVVFLDPMTRGEMPRCVFAQRRHLGFAAIERQRAASMKAAPRRRIDRRRDVARQNDALSPFLHDRVGNRNG